MREVVFSSTIVAAASACASHEAIQAMRKSPPRFGDIATAGHFLKHVDEQTVVAMEAIRLATQRFGLNVAEQTRWGIISAPRYIGRASGCEIVRRFYRVGTSGVATHAAAQFSLNSVSGVAGIAMGIRGPNLGVGGGVGTISEGFTAALTLFDTAETPGVWFVTTGWSKEPIPDETGALPEGCLCYAVALALVPGAVGRSKINLRLPGRGAGPSVRLSGEDYDPSIMELASFVEAAGNAVPASWSCMLPEGGTIELQLNAATERLRTAA